MRCTLLHLGLCLWVAFHSPRASADGKFFRPPSFARAETPSQRALIHWHDGIQTLAVENTLLSDASELAWILPLPTAPQAVVPVGPGLFPTLQNLFQPRVITLRSSAWVGAAVVGVIAFLVRWRVQRKIPLRAFDAIVVLGVLAILGSMLLPALGVAKAGPEAAVGTASGVRVLSETRAGVYDVATLSASRAPELTAWLRERGFAVPATLEPVVRDYLDRGWVFAAARVRNPTPDSLAAVHPIAFRFPTPTPVYPMRLTGVEAERLECDLYVFGPDRAEADGWKAPYCGKPDFSPRTSPAIAAFPLRVRHPELASLVSPAAVATKLTARLSGEAFSRDVAIRWDRFRSKGQTLHANGAAWSRSLGWGAWVLAGIACLGGLPGFRGKCPAPWFSPTDRYGAGLAGLVVVLGYLATPRAPAERISTVPRHTIAHMKQVLLAMAVEASDLAEVQAVVRLPFEADRSNGVARLRTTFTEMLRTNQTLRPVPRAGPPSNPFTGLPCRIEASPGNVHLEATPTGLDVVWYDFDGAAAYRYDIPRSDLPPDSTTDAPRSTIAR